MGGEDKQARVHIIPNLNTVKIGDKRREGDCVSLHLPLYLYLRHRLTTGTRTSFSSAGSMALFASSRQRIGASLRTALQRHSSCFCPTDNLMLWLLLLPFKPPLLRSPPPPERCAYTPRCCCCCSFPAAPGYAAVTPRDGSSRPSLPPNAPPPAHTTQKP